MRAHEFINPIKTILREYKRDITVRQYGPAIINAWQNGPEGFEITDEKSKDAFLDKIMQSIEAADPTSNKMYSTWLAREYAKRNIKRLEDLTGWTPILSDYHRYKARGDFPAQAKDIMRTSASNSADNGLAVLIKPYTDAQNASQDKPPENERGYSDAIYEDDDVRVIQPLDKTAACYYGQGTTWCTAATRSENRFEQYNREGPLYILLPKKPKYIGEKYQIQFETDQFMDKNDNDVGIGYIFRDRFPQLREVFEKLGNKGFNDYIDLMPDETLLGLYEAGYKLILKYLDKSILDSGYKEISVDTYMDEMEEWFGATQTANQVRITVEQMRNTFSADYATFSSLKYVYQYILTQTHDDYERNNRRNRYDPWPLYLDDDEIKRIGKWIKDNLYFYRKDFFDTTPTDKTIVVGDYIVMIKKYIRQPTGY
jgi:hypothetical protein